MDKQEEQTVIVTDGAYSGLENVQLAADKNVEPITIKLDKIYYSFDLNIIL